MPLESATYIDDLDPSYPLGTDNVSQGDDHLRLIKSTLQNSFTNATYPIDFSKLGSPTGSVVLYAGATAPDGYLLCDGSAVSRTTYADLYIAIGTAWGAGNGSTTFNLPSMDDKVPGGVGANALGAEDGKNTITASDLPRMNTQTDGVHRHAIDEVLHPDNTTPEVNINPDDFNFSYNRLVYTETDGEHKHVILNSNLATTNNRQLTAYFNYIIKT